MKLHLNLSLRRALLAALAAVSTLSGISRAGVADERYDLQYYLDFARNKGMFTPGAIDISVYYKDGTTTVTNPVIPIMPNLDSYAQRGQILMGALSPLGGRTWWHRNSYPALSTVTKMMSFSFRKTPIQVYSTHPPDIPAKGRVTGVCSDSTKL